MEDSVDPDEGVELDWGAAADQPAEIASQFLVQLALPVGGTKPDGVHLVVGDANPPVVVGSETLKAEQKARYGGRLPVTVHGRYYLTRARLGELCDALNTLAVSYDEAVEGVNNADE